MSQAKSFTIFGKKRGHQANGSHKSVSAIAAKKPASAQKRVARAVTAAGVTAIVVDAEVTAATSSAGAEAAVAVATSMATMAVAQPDATGAAPVEVAAGLPTAAAAVGVAAGGVPAPDLEVGAREGVGDDKEGMGCGTLRFVWPLPFLPQTLPPRAPMLPSTCRAKQPRRNWHCLMCCSLSKGAGTSKDMSGIGLNYAYPGKRCLYLLDCHAIFPEW